MIIFKKAEELTEYIEAQKNAGKSIGFVPTMGALHAGHLTLVAEAAKGNHLTVASIFVNPTQFNNPDDFKHYPVTIESDVERLLQSRTDLLFLPSVEEIYPAGSTAKHYDLGAIEHRLEGHYRPGHFQGVCQVVDRLLSIVRPHRLYLGQKDFQQCMVIRHMLELTGRSEPELRIVPTRRENDGLAMSSRNLRLNAAQRSLAPAIHVELSRIRENLGKIPFPELKQRAADSLTAKGFAVDYVEIARQHDLAPASDASSPLVILAAASLGSIRLIDNLVVQPADS